MLPGLAWTARYFTCTNLGFCRCLDFDFVLICMCLGPDFCLENQTPELDGMLSTDSFNEESAGGLGIMMFA